MWRRQERHQPGYFQPGQFASRTLAQPSNTGALRLVALIIVLPSLLAGAGKQNKSQLRQGNRLYEQHRFAEAAAAYTQAAEQNPADPRAYYNRALANEMVNRQSALADWQHFLELAGPDPKWSNGVKQIQERVQALQAMPTLPATLQLERYNPKEDDYYEDVAGQSAGWQWKEFPVRVCLQDPPPEWQRAALAAMEEWSRVIPLERVNSPGDANITLAWSKSSMGAERIGVEEDVRETRMQHGKVTHLKRSEVTFDASRHWPDDDMLAASLQELGHALGIRGHGGRPHDVMYPEVQHTYSVQKGGRSPNLEYRGPSGVYEQSSAATKLSPRDINTLIRIYNSPSPLSPLE